MCAYKSRSGRPVSEGGTENTIFVKYSVIVGGDTSISALQQANPTSDTTAILVSNGPTSPPSFQIPPIPQMNFQVLASDPGSPGEGQVWYNSTTDLFKGAKIGSGTWTTKTAMNTARSQCDATGTTADDVLACAGNAGAGATGTTERYDGGANTWTNKTAMNQVETNNSCAGGATDALTFGGGSLTTSCELYDGVGNTWTAKTNMNTGIKDGGGGGTSSNALQCGGTTGAVSAVTQKYDGTPTIVTFTVT